MTTKAKKPSPDLPTLLSEIAAAQMWVTHYQKAANTLGNERNRYLLAAAEAKAIVAATVGKDASLTQWAKAVTAQAEATRQATASNRGVGTHLQSVAANEAIIEAKLRIIKRIRRSTAAETPTPTLEDVRTVFRALVIRDTYRRGGKYQRAAGILKRYQVGNVNDLDPKNYAAVIAAAGVAAAASNNY